MPKPRHTVTAQNGTNEALSPRSAVGGTSESIAKLQIDTLHWSLAATVGRNPQAMKHPREKD
jgi:hypothetical protein